MGGRGMGGGGGGMDFGELEQVMERFLWQSYPQHLQSTLFHSERIAPLRKKSLQERLDHAYEFKKRGDDRVADKKWREAVTQYEFAYGLFKYCDKVGKKITMHDDTKPARELRQQQRESGELGQRDVAFHTFWLEVDEMMCSCLTLIGTCKMAFRNPATEEALSACNEALEFRSNHVPALYRRSQVYLAMENYSEAVADAHEAFRCAEDEEIKFDMWKHRKHCYAERRANTFFWGFCGFVYDLPWTICGLPWTIAAMSPKRQALLVTLLSLSIGVYRLPSGTLSSLVPSLRGAAPPLAEGGAAAAAAEANASLLAAMNSSLSGANGSAAMESSEGSAAAVPPAKGGKAAKEAAKRAEKEAKAKKKAEEKAAKEAAKRAAAKAKEEAKLAKARAKEKEKAAKAWAKEEAKRAKAMRMAAPKKKTPPPPSAAAAAAAAAAKSRAQAPQPALNDVDEEEIVVQDVADDEDGW